MRMPSDGGRVEEDACAAQGSQARSLGVPLVPADQRTQVPHGGIEGSESEVSRTEVKLLVIRRVIGDVHLAIRTKQFSVRLNHGGGVVIYPRRPALKHRSNHNRMMLAGGALHDFCGGARNAFSEIE